MIEKREARSERREARDCHPERSSPQGCEVEEPALNEVKGPLNDLSSRAQRGACPERSEGTCVIVDGPGFGALRARPGVSVLANPKAARRVFTPASPAPRIDMRGWGHRFTPPSAAPAHASRFSLLASRSSITLGSRSSALLPKPHRLLIDRRMMRGREPSQRLAQRGGEFGCAEEFE